MTGDLPTAPSELASDAARPGPEADEHYGLELITVLGVSLGMSGVYALLSLIHSELTVPGGISHATATVVAGAQTAHPWLDFAYNIAGIINGIFPPLLALVLLARRPGGAGFGIGFDLRRIRPETAQGVGFLALIGIPGLGLVWAANQLGINASLNVVDFPDVWYRVPYLLLSAFQNGFAEEIIVVAYMLTRLRQIGWSKSPALLASATLRGSYHLYQGFGGFAGNFVMGLIFGWWFQRTRRVVPLVIAHFLLDAFSFIGYLYLHGHVSWI
ncbi:MAG TPA: CPBP family intramembrane glutamic endopeptidase [Jatrophihabitans sp.]|nr:CPBP family intramembrane glutamic endopeptidase [Jatrophihabitans sp.]